MLSIPAVTAGCHSCSADAIACYMCRVLQVVLFVIDSAHTPNKMVHQLVRTTLLMISSISMKFDVLHDVMCAEHHAHTIIDHWMLSERHIK
jgi:hypothetical protein